MFSLLLLSISSPGIHLRRPVRPSSFKSGFEGEVTLWSVSANPQKPKEIDRRPIMLRIYRPTTIQARAPHTASIRRFKPPVTVPATQWLSVELYVHRSTGSDGRFHWGVNGQTIADHYERINLLMFSIVYGYGRPAYQWIDDLEVWNLPPCSLLPCGAT